MARLVTGAAVFLFVAGLALGQDRPALWGTVLWQTGTPAAGLEVRLVGEGRVAATTFTNQAGRFGFFGVQGDPSRSSLQVLYHGTLLRELALHGTPAGGRVPDIVVRR